MISCSQPHKGLIEVPLPVLLHAQPGLSITLHPAARAAYEWLETYPRLVNWSTLPSSLVNPLLEQPLHGVMRSDTKTTVRGRIRKVPVEFQFYAPLWPARYWPGSQAPSGTLLIYDDSSATRSFEEIEKVAWLSVLQLLVFSVDTNLIAALRDDLQELLPEPLSHSLFGKKKVSDADLCRWTGLSRGTLIQQRQRTRTGTPAPDPADPLARLAKPWKSGQ